jgi:hypothetical protein
MGKPQAIIRIANPLHGSAEYTSMKRAQHLVRMGRAAITSDGYLFFFEAATVVARREQERVDAAIRQYNSGVVLWNGSAKNTKRGPALHQPGEVRS